jgi:hypothetical protein
MEMDDRTMRQVLERHWAASDASDFQVEHEIYCEDAVLEYPQSGERLRGRRNIQESRFVQPNKKRFTVRKIVGSGELWVTEFILSYDDMPSYAVSIGMPRSLARARSSWSISFVKSGAWAAAKPSQRFLKSSENSRPVIRSQK